MLPDKLTIPIRLQGLKGAARKLRKLVRLARQLEKALEHSLDLAATLEEVLPEKARGYQPVGDIDRAKPPQGGSGLPSSP